MDYPHVYRNQHTETTTTNALYGEYFTGTKKNKIKIQPPLLKILQYIDSNRPTIEKDLSEAIAIKSVTSNRIYQDEVRNMTNFLKDRLIQLDMKYEVFNIGTCTIAGKTEKLPPIILASLGNDPKKITLGACAHVDVTDPKGEIWHTDPWTLTIKDNNYIGKGVSSGKGPLLCWFHVLQAFQHQKMPLPVNLKICIEMMHTQHSVGLAAFVVTKKQEFFNLIDYAVELSGEWLGPKVPSLIYGTAGDLHMDLTIEGNSKEALKEDMNKIFDTIVDETNTIIIPHFMDNVERITPDEELFYVNLKEFDPESIRNSLPPHQRGWNKVKLLMSFWRQPSIFIDEIEECSCDNRQNQMIRRQFRLKIVPLQIVERTEKRIRSHIKNVIKAKNIKNKVNVNLLRSTRPWRENYNSYNFQCAKRAILQIYKQEPNLIREDVGRETAAVFDTVLEKSFVVIPIRPKSLYLDKANETMPSRCYSEGTKVLAAYMFQLANPKFK